MDVNGSCEKITFKLSREKIGVDSQSCKGWRLSTIMVIKYMDRGNKSAFEAEKHNWTVRMTRFTR